MTRYVNTWTAILNLDSLFVFTTENLEPSLTSWQAAEVQMTQEHAWGVHFEQRSFRTFMCIVLTVILTKMTADMTVYWHQWLLCRLRMCVPRSCLWVIWMAIIRSGWVLQRQCQGHTRQTVVCHHAYVCLSWLMVICQSRPHYISENQTSACQTTM